MPEQNDSDNCQLKAKQGPQKEAREPPSDKPKHKASAPQGLSSSRGGGGMREAKPISCQPTALPPRPTYPPTRRPTCLPKRGLFSVWSESLGSWVIYMGDRKHTGTGFPCAGRNPCFTEALMGRAGRKVPLAASNSEANPSPSTGNNQVRLTSGADRASNTREAVI